MCQVSELEKKLEVLIMFNDQKEESERNMKVGSYVEYVHFGLTMMMMMMMTIVLMPTMMVINKMIVLMMILLCFDANHLSDLICAPMAIVTDEPTRGGEVSSLVCYPPNYLSIHLPFHPSIHPCDLFMFPSIYPSIHLSIDPSASIHHPSNDPSI
jgi:hypothetical protein